jgi:hypothetical protein
MKFVKSLLIGTGSLMLAGFALTAAPCSTIAH